jgi:DNA-binding GntR family transcriptional regulator
MDTIDAVLPPPPHKVAEVAGAIERDIHVGRLGKGTWLKQIDLEERYGVSRIVVRQALDRLVEKGLVRLVARRGYCVEDMPDDRLRQILGVRAILEMAAAEEVMGKFSAAELDRLDKLAAAFAESVARGTVEEQEATNRAFHVEMLRACPNRELVALTFEMRSRVPLAVTRQKNTRPLLEGTARDHFEMVECLRQGDLERLRAVLRRHVLAGLPEN